MPSPPRRPPAPPSTWPAPDTPILVAVVTRPADLGRAGEGWYRLPVAHAPPRLGCEALAFYQTGAFGPDGHAVRVWAAVRRVSIARRRDILPDEPRHPRADALYYRFELGPLTALARPVPARRLRRVTFIPTTWQRLVEAQDVADLWLRHPGGVARPEAEDDEYFALPSRILLPA
ncbi:MAG: hypothetical protein U0822_15545 [Anaerolineae bacterium]